MNKLGAIDRLFPLKLRGTLLRSFNGPDGFTHNHGIALNYLMRKPCLSLSPQDAILQIQGLNIHAIKKLVRTLTAPTAKYILKSAKRGLLS